MLKSRMQRELSDFLFSDLWRNSYSLCYLPILYASNYTTSYLIGVCGGTAFSFRATSMASCTFSEKDEPATYLRRKAMWGQFNAWRMESSVIEVLFDFFIFLALRFSMASATDAACHSLRGSWTVHTSHSWKQTNASVPWRGVPIRENLVSIFQ